MIVVKPKVDTGDKYVSDASSWSKVGGSLGGNPGGTYQDKAGGKWYVKFPPSADAAHSEILASKFYQMLGFGTTNQRMVMIGGKIGIASKMQPLFVDKGKLTSGDSAVMPQFIAHAWLGNWDAVGANPVAGKGFDNIQFTAGGKPVIVEAGGALSYTGLGKKMAYKMTDDVSELDTLRDPSINPTAAAVFGGVSQEAILSGVKQLAKMKESQIWEMVDKIGPGSEKEKVSLVKTLVSRRAFILNKYGVADPWVPLHPDMTNLPIDPAKLPAPINFMTANDGKPVHSKPHLNEQNSIDSAALVAFAAHGNLQALKDYKYDAFDKQTGAPLGKKPIIEHPSGRIITQWTELVEMLQAIAYPSVDALEMPPLGVASTVDEISSLVGYYSPTERVETVAAENRMHFFMKIAHIDDIAGLLEGMKFDYIKSDSPFLAAASAVYKKSTSAVKAFISGVQGGGWPNHVFSQGQSTLDVGAHHLGVQSMAAQLYKDAIEVPEGTILTRGMKDTSGGKMKQQLIDAKPGLVMQDTDSMCTSKKKDWSWGGDLQMTIKCAKGCKALPSFASGHYGHEEELTTLPGARFVLLSLKRWAIQFTSKCSCCHHMMAMSLNWAN